MRKYTRPHRFFREAAALALVAGLAVPIVASASPVATVPTVKSFTPKSGATGAKVTIKGTGLSAVSKVSWVLYPGPKTYVAKFTKTATKIVATAPAAYPSKTSPGLIELKAGTSTVTVDCWGAC